MGIIEKNRCLIIAEAGVNHNGDIDIALKLCDAAKEIGADVIKFQTWKTEKMITKDLKQAEYQIRNTGNDESQFEMLKKLEMSYESFRIIKDYCDQIGIIFSSTADEVDSLNFLIELGIPFIKIGSGDIENVPLLKRAAKSELPIILSTGMCTIEDVEFAVNVLKKNGAEKITLLHCTTNYPCPYDEVNLRAMITLKEKFHLAVGYSDHTMGIEVPIAAVAMGAKVVEKHFTLDCNMSGPDHIASTQPEDFKKMIISIRNIEKSLGNGRKLPTMSEKEISKVITKRIVALTNIEEGEVLTEKNICVKRHDKGILARKWEEIIGRKANRSYMIDEGIED